MINNILATQIIRMKEMDQALRFHVRDLGTTTDLPNYLVYVMDTAHNAMIRNIIQQHGYPTQKIVGKTALQAFWLLVQHQDDDLALQEDCLKNCNFAPKENALLFDRVAVNSGRKQYYGTQYGAPIDKPKEVDARRKEVGLDPIATYHARMKKMFPKGPPRTYKVLANGKIKMN